MTRLSESQRHSLQNAVSSYHQALPGSPAEEFLSRRGLADSTSSFRFGYVEEPLPGHERHQGKLAIPYLRWHPRHGWSCVSMRFRALDNETKPKYASLAGDKPRLYNTPELNTNSEVIAICEGELDAVTVSLTGMPCVGVPGAASWQPFWAELFRGYKTVNVLADGDAPGEKLARTIAKQLPNARVIHLPEGEDANSIFNKEGEEALRSMWRQP